MSCSHSLYIASLETFCSRNSKVGAAAAAGRRTTLAAAAAGRRTLRAAAAAGRRKERFTMTRKNPQQPNKLCLTRTYHSTCPY